MRTIATKQEMKSTREQDVTPSRKALQVAGAAEGSGRNTFAHLSLHRPAEPSAENVEQDRRVTGQGRSEVQYDELNEHSHLPGTDELDADLDVST